MAHQPFPRLDSTPVLRAIELRGLRPGKNTNDPTWRLVNRARSQGLLPFWTADLICVRLLGVHPASIYGEAWWDVIAA